MKTTKPFPATKRQVWEAWKRVRANQGGPGIDRQSLADYGSDLGNILYKVWNRMASGSYHPIPVRRVNIPKADGGVRRLGIPTVTDKLAQMVAVMVLEPKPAQRSPIAAGNHGPTSQKECKNQKEKVDLG